VEGREMQTPSDPQFMMREIEYPSIAVFMFNNLEENKNSSSVRIGITCELIVALTKFVPFQIIGPLTKDSNKEVDFRQIQSEYKAQFVLQGWISTQGSNVKIIVALSDTSTRKKIWGKTYHFDLEDTSLFKIEEELTGQIAAAVGDGLGIIFRQIKHDTYNKHITYNDVTQAVFAYNTAWFTQHPDDWRKAYTSLKNAIKLHPQNALLLALEVNVHYGDVMFEMGITSNPADRMEALATKAISLDPNLQIARYNMVVINSYFNRKEACIREAKIVEQMNPNHARILAGCSIALTSVGAYDLAKQYVERAKQLNPQYPGWYHFVAYMQFFANGQYNEAWLEVQKIHIEGTFIHPILRGAILGKLNKIDEAKLYIQEIFQIKPDFLKNPRRSFQALFVTEKHMDIIWDGLCLAGIEEY